MKCLVYQLKGYHVFCNWRKLQCEHNIGPNEFVNHCKYCLIGMAEAINEKWVDDYENPIQNPFETTLYT